MSKCKYCVANVYINCRGEGHISFYAYKKGPYGLHLVEDWDNENVLWYDTEQEAKKHILNSCECVISRLAEHIKSIKE